MKFIKNLLGLESQSPYIHDFLEESNAKACAIVSVAIIILETWAVISLAVSNILGTHVRTFQWNFCHFISYAVLTITAFFMFFSSLKFLRGKIIQAHYWRACKYLFILACISFGIYISYLDYMNGEQLFTFISMEIFVMCILVLRPIVCAAVLTVSFLLFYFLCVTRLSSSYATKINLILVYVSILLANVNLYRQRMQSAKKAEALEEMGDRLAYQAITDEVTGVSNMANFRDCAKKLLANENVDLQSVRFLFLDIENFKNYNEKNGFEAGNLFLKKTAQIVEKEFSRSLTARFSDDHFVVLTREDNIIEKLDIIRNEIKKLDNGIHMGLKVGSYTPDSRDCPPSVACDRARYACREIRKRFGEDYREYSRQMDEVFRKKQYIINSIDKAISDKFIKVFYQPVVWAKDGTLCGVEALARWIDPVHGFLSPEDFVSVLEEYRLVHKLDVCVLETVCQDLQEWQMNGEKTVPVSVNFSRIDFEAVDIVSKVQFMCEKYKISKSWLHIEITESALTEDDGLLQTAMDSFRNAGYALWLDDFGSGYSGLNVLKDYEFDMMKIDMKFLKNFGANEKTRPILKSIVSLAKQIGMQTLTEGVETVEMSDFLRTIGCERLQGYLFGKPMPKEELLELVHSGKLKIR